MGLWYIGVVIYITGAVMMALGVNLQKYSLDKNVEHKSKLKQPIWLVGVTFYISSGIMLSVALVFASQSQLSPLMSMVLVSNIIFAHFLLGESISKWDIIGMAIIISGVTITTITAPRSEDILSKEELIDLYKQPLFICYILVIIGVIIVLLVINKTLEKRNVLDNVHYWRIYGITFAALAGFFGGWCVTMMKSTITILVDQASEGGFVGVVSSWLMWLLVLLLGGTWIMQLYWLNKGLEQFPVIFIVSIEAIVNEFVAVLGGMLYFEEYKLFTVGTGIGFAIGLLLGMVGVGLFAHQADLGSGMPRKMNELTESASAKPSSKSPPTSMMQV